MSSTTSKKLPKGLSFHDKDGKAILPDYQGRKEDGAWFGSEVLKRRTVEAMEKHRELDEIIQGLYQAGKLMGNDTETEFRGCLVGCTLPPMNYQYMDDLEHHFYDAAPEPEFMSWHTLVERFYNIPAGVASVLDDEFENTYDDDAPEFAVDALKAIPVGAVYAALDIDELLNRDRVDSAATLEWLANPTMIVGQVSV